MPYFAFQEHKNLLAMGLHRLSLADWLMPDDRLTEELDLKRQLWEQRGPEVFCADPGSMDAQWEVAQAIGDHLPNRFPGVYDRRPNGLYCRVADQAVHWDDPATALLMASWCVQEDLCLLQPGDDGRYTLTAASLCAPSYWRLLDKVGQPLDAIHAPVPGYADRLDRPVNRFFERLKTDQPVWRGNWSVVTSDRLYQPGGEESEPIDRPDDIPERCFLRTERQTLRRMPNTGAVLFTIRVELRSLRDYVDDAAVLGDLRTALSGLDEAERRYKSLHWIEPALSTWLDRRLAGMAKPEADGRETGGPG